MNTPTIEIYTLCPSCNKECAVEKSYYRHEVISAFQNCPHCKVRIDTWLRIPYPEISKLD